MSPRTVTLTDTLITENIGLARMVAHDYARHHPEIGYEDFFSVASIGLCKAAPRFQPGQCKFGSYAIRFIRGECNHYLRDKSRLVRSPRGLHDLYLKGRKYRGLPDKEIAEALEVSLEQWLDAKHANQPKLVEHDERVHGESAEIELESEMVEIPRALAQLRQRIEALNPQDQALLGQLLSRRGHKRSPEKVGALREVLDRLAC